MPNLKEIFEYLRLPSRHNASASASARYEREDWLHLLNIREIGKFSKFFFKILCRQTKSET